MKFTNKHGLPEQFVKAVTNHEHRSADYSATQIQKSPRQIWLERRHDDDIYQDVGDRVWALFGSMAHSYLEKHQAKNSLSEEYMTMDVTLDDGTVVKLSGTADLYNLKDGGTIEDYKTTSVWAVLI